MDIILIGDSIIDTFILTDDLGENPDDLKCLKIRASKVYSSLGGSLNIATNIQSLGGSCLYIGYHNTKIRDIFYDAGGKINLVYRAPFHLMEEPIYTILRYINEKGSHLLRIDPTTQYVPIDLTVLPLGIYPEAKVVIISDYTLGTIRHNVVKQVQLRWPAAKIIIDSRDPRAFHGVRNVTFKMNESEYDKLSEGFRQANKTINNFLVTRGPKSVMFNPSEGLELRIIPPKITVSDLTGAGDSFTAAYSIALSEGIDDRNAIIKATKAASFSASQPGICQVKQGDL